MTLAAPAVAVTEIGPAAAGPPSIHSHIGTPTNPRSPVDACNTGAGKGSCSIAR
ncbi:hypothetical protein [Pseudonocardia sediminis]|uniref:hypothetical protein n=1 Tax=Pseudonocardia sediminis TaxID=1397368 RepID=UPI0013EF17EA|nr:hypothetical protein [Pseudonocardia sediminis]